MNNRFKFRVWENNTRNCYLKDEKTAIIGDGDLIYGDITNAMQLSYGEDNPNIIVEQCTGLKDKNGNLIYESDLVRGAENTIGIVKYGKHPRTNSDSMELGFYIEWQMKYPYRSDICYWTSPENKDCIEIIGNIHEQAEQKDVKCQQEQI